MWHTLGVLIVAWQLAAKHLLFEMHPLQDEAERNDGAQHGGV